MIKPLRKRHRQVWLLLAVLLPVGIIVSWLIIPNPAAVTLLKQTTPALLPVIKYTMDKKEYAIHIRTNKENTEWQLEWKNKLALTVPSAVIYKTTGNNTGIKNGQLIGRIEARGDYIFVLPQDTSGYDKLHLTIYDFIHQQTIDSINFQP